MPTLSSHLLARTSAAIWLVALVVGAALALPPAAGATPAVGGISARPLQADGTPLRGAYFDVTREPGSSYDAALEITNVTDRAIPVHVAPVDATTSTGGGTAFLARSAPRRGVGAWISPGDRPVTLGAQATTRVPLRVAIPKDAAPGDHVGGIVVEPERTTRLGTSADITRVVRVVLAVRIRVPGPARTALDLRDLRVTRGTPTTGPMLTVRMVNRGDRLCRPTVDASLATVNDVVSAEHRAVDTVLPGTAADYPLRWSRPVADGTYRVQLRATGCGAPAAISDLVVLDHAAPSDAAAVASAPPATTAGLAALPLAAQAGAGAALLLAFGALGWRLARRPRRGHA